MREFALFAVIRVAMILVLWWLLRVIGLGVYLAPLAAIVIAMLLSIVLLAPLRQKVAQRWESADEERRDRGPRGDADAEAEDELIHRR